jgi:hypothetical protein
MVPEAKEGQQQETVCFRETGGVFRVKRVTYGVRWNTKHAVRDWFDGL